MTNIAFLKYLIFNSELCNYKMVINIWEVSTFSHSNSNLQTVDCFMPARGGYVHLILKSNSTLAPLCVLGFVRDF